MEVVKRAQQGAIPTLQMLPSVPPVQLAIITVTLTRPRVLPALLACLQVTLEQQSALNVKLVHSMPTPPLLLVLTVSLVTTPTQGVTSVTCALRVVTQILTVLHFVLSVNQARMQA